MSDSYYKLIDSTDGRGERFIATDLARSTWSASIQHGAPVSALLTRALERCEQRSDTRLSRVVVDLLGGVPADGEFWVSARIERPGKQIELVSAQMLGPGPDGPRLVAQASGWRMQMLDTEGLTHAAEPPLRPLSEARSRDIADDRVRNYVHSLDWRWLTAPLNEGPGESWLNPTTTLVGGETTTPLQRLFSVADCANGLGSRIDTRKWTFLNTDLDRNPGRNRLRARRRGGDHRHALRPERTGRRHPAVRSGAPPSGRAVTPGVTSVRRNRIPSGVAAGNTHARPRR
jgi:hypothetical protein